MVTAYGYADIEADSEAEALDMVDDMDTSDFYWDNDFSSLDAEIVERIDN
jgi:hypothetical protein